MLVPSMKYYLARLTKVYDIVLPAGAPMLFCMYAVHVQGGSTAAVPAADVGFGFWLPTKVGMPDSFIYYPTHRRRDGEGGSGWLRRTEERVSPSCVAVTTLCRCTCVSFFKLRDEIRRRRLLTVVGVVSGEACYHPRDGV